MSYSISNEPISTMESKEMEITLLHMSGSFLGPLFLGAPYSGKSKGSSSGSWPWSWLSRCSGSQLSLSSLMIFGNLVVINEYLMLLDEYH